MDVQVVKQSELPARELIGADHGGVGVCVIFVDAEPGAGPSLHKHPYEELFILLDGEATFIAGEQEVRARAGEMVIVPPDTPHAFTNSGDRPLRQIDIHVSPTFSTEWL